MSLHPEIDPIDELFRNQSPSVEDRGFTARVIEALPRRRRRLWISPAILLSAAIVGSVLAVLWVPWGNLPAMDPSDLIGSAAHVLQPWSFALAVVASVIWSVVAALRPYSPS